MRNLCIGFLDSGIGGLVYYKECRAQFELMKNEYGIICDYVYLADNKAFPYGTQTEDFLIGHLCDLCIEYIVRAKLDVLVLACNTASLLVLDMLRARIAEERSRGNLIIGATKVVGTVPAIKTAVDAGSQRVYVMNTNVTSNSNYAKAMASNTKEQYGKDSQVFLRGCQELVEAIQTMLLKDEESYRAFAIALLDKIIGEIIELRCETVVLGCTHFLHIKKELRTLLPESVSIVDSLHGVTKRIVDVCRNFEHTGENELETLHALELQENQSSQAKFFCTKESPELGRLSEQYGLVYKGIL